MIGVGCIGNESVGKVIQVVRNPCGFNASFYARKIDAEEHIGNRELFVRTSMQELKTDNINEYDEIIRSVCIIYVDTVVGIKRIMVERDEMN